MKELFVAILMWASHTTGLPWNGQLPTTVIMSKNDVCVSAGESKGCDIYAFYNPVQNVMVLPYDWRPNNVLDQSFLVHELTHYLQRNSILNDEKCSGLYEYQAYETQIEMLKEAKVTPPDFLEWLAMNYKMSCEQSQT